MVTVDDRGMPLGHTEECPWVIQKAREMDCSLETIDLSLWDIVVNN